mmetsp:Transcript_19444/g.52026  ORF Transcript_19444/g.52026 Transcript_19444/m.52026 type:complete len:211 (+) Transcript_19444:349-981(+)
MVLRTAKVHGDQGHLLDQCPNQTRRRFLCLSSSRVSASSCDRRGLTPRLGTLQARWYGCRSWCGKRSCLGLVKSGILRKSAGRFHCPLTETSSAGSRREAGRLTPSQTLRCGSRVREQKRPARTLKTQRCPACSCLTNAREFASGYIEPKVACSSVTKWVWVRHCRRLCWCHSTRRIGRSSSFALPPCASCGRSRPSGGFRKCATGTGCK